MKNKKKQETEKPLMQVSIQLTGTERLFIQDAAKENGDAFLSSYIREAALERSHAILGCDLEQRKRTQPLKRPKSELLHAYNLMEKFAMFDLVERAREDGRKPYLLYDALKIELIFRNN